VCSVDWLRHHRATERAELRDLPCSRILVNERGHPPVHCLTCQQPPEKCECIEVLAEGLTPATAVAGTDEADPERRSTIWIREDTRYGPPFLTVFLEPGPKATVDDLRLAVGALVRWRNAVNARVRKPFTEDAALEAILGMHEAMVQKRGPRARGIHVAAAEGINERLAGLLRENAQDVSLRREADELVAETEGEPSSLDDAIRQVLLRRYEAGEGEAARYNSGMGGTIAESYLRALGYSPDAAAQICERATEDILLGREPFGPEYPADRRRARECVRKAQRRGLGTDPNRG